MVLLETPLTIAKYAPGEYSSNQEVRDDIDQQFSNYNQRKLGVNFTGAARSTSRYNNRVILYNKTFDEEGYYSFYFLLLKISGRLIIEAL